MRQDGLRAPVLDDEDRQGRVATVLGEEAVAHGNLRHGVLARESAGVGSVRHPPTHAVRAPRPEWHARAFVPLSLLVGGGRR
eukprot:13585282-Alexandrium_andersonii.AAC.1